MRRCSSYDQDLKIRSRPISRVLSWTAIHLDIRRRMPQAAYPGTVRATLNVPLFGLAPGGVYHAAECYHRRGALLPHLFTLTSRNWRYIFCCTGRRLTPPRRYLAPCPMEPGLSSRKKIPSDCLADSMTKFTGF